jgi:hypothetical protein
MLLVLSLPEEPFIQCMLLVLSCLQCMLHVSWFFASVCNCSIELLADNSFNETTEWNIVAFPGHYLFAKRYRLKKLEEVWRSFRVSEDWFFQRFLLVVPYITSGWPCEEVPLYQWFDGCDVHSSGISCVFYLLQLQYCNCNEMILANICRFSIVFSTPDMSIAY